MQVFPALMVGVAIGSNIYGFIPVDFVAKYARSDNSLAKPFAAVIGIHLYIRANARKSV